MRGENSTISSLLVGSRHPQTLAVDTNRNCASGQEMMNEIMINTGLIAINDAQRCRQIKHENVDYFPQFLVGCYALSYLGMYSACTLN